ncbi:MAG: polysaccharide biosynthesis/export family protein [Pyrinomonadaceae bacterium]
MKKLNSVIAITLATAFAVSSAASVFAQTQDDASNKTRQRLAAASQEPKGSKTTTQKPTQNTAPGERLEPDDSSRVPADVPADTQANRQEQMSEAEGAIVPYYNNFFNSYRLGPEDVISINVFGQDRYSRAAVIIPPSGRVALALIPEGIFVNGKTVEEVSELIKKRYDEYIIDPQVTVSLEKASSYRYSILGDVAQPGVRLMSRRLTVTEAIAEAGGVLSTGDKSKVTVLRRQANGSLAQIAVNVSAIYKKGAPDTTYLVPGDQILVPGNKMKKVRDIFSTFSPMLSFARIFGLPVPY